MNIVYLSYFFDPDLERAEALLARYSTMTNFCTALKNAGAESVTAVQRFKRNEVVEQENVRYMFVSDGRHGQPKIGQSMERVHACVAAIQPDVVHHNGWPLPLASLRRALPSRTAIVWQHHGGGVPGIRTSWFHRRGFRVVDACFFTSASIANPWKRRSLIPADSPIYEILEGSSTLLPLSYESMREKQNLAGSPTFLWVGRLDSNKDPLTVIEGLSICASDLPDAHLYMVYGENHLGRKVHSRIVSAHMEDRIHLLENLSPAMLQELYSGSDYFVLGSHTEGSGFALLEALSCGTTPIVTGIPSFKQITGNGSVGSLWNPGDPSSLASAIMRTVRTPPDRKAVRAHFDLHLRFDVIAREALAAYEQIRQRRNGKS